jgi:translation initiation factor IF-1
VPEIPSLRAGRATIAVRCPAAVVSGARSGYVAPAQAARGDAHGVVRCLCERWDEISGSESGSESGSGTERENLSRDDLIQATGTVEKILGGGRYQITLESGQTVTAQLSGRMRRFRIRVIPGDRVQVGLSPYDPTHGFITFRLREGQSPPT